MKQSISIFALLIGICLCSNALADYTTTITFCPTYKLSSSQGKIICDNLHKELDEYTTYQLVDEAYSCIFNLSNKDTVCTNNPKQEIVITLVSDDDDS